MQRTQHFQQSEVYRLISNDAQQMRVSKDFESGFQSGQSTTENTPGSLLYSKNTQINSGENRSSSINSNINQQLQKNLCNKQTSKSKLNIKQQNAKLYQTPQINKNNQKHLQLVQLPFQYTSIVITPTNQTKNQQSNLDFGDKASKNKNMRLGSCQQQARNQIELSGCKTPSIRKLNINNNILADRLKGPDTSQKHIRKSLQIQQSPATNLVQQQFELKNQDNENYVEFNRLNKSPRITNVGDFQKVVDKRIIENFTGTKPLIFQQEVVLDYQLRPNQKNSIHRRAPSQNAKKLAKVRHQYKQSKMMMEIPKEFIDYRLNYQTQIKLNGNNQGNFSSKKLNNQTNSKNEGGQIQMTLSKQSLIQKIPASKISQKLQQLIDDGSTTNKLRDSKIREDDSSKRYTHCQIQESDKEVISSPQLYKSKANLNNQRKSNIGSLQNNTESKVMTKYVSSVRIQRSSDLSNNTNASTLVGVKIPYISHIMTTKNLTGKELNRNNNQRQNYQNIKKSRWTTTCISSNRNPGKANDFDNLLNISNCDSVSSKSAISSFRDISSCEEDIE
eukprot:403363694